MKKAIATFMFELILFGLGAIGMGLIFGGMEIIFGGFITIPPFFSFLVKYLFGVGGILTIGALVAFIATIRRM